MNLESIKKGLEKRLKANATEIELLTEKIMEAEKLRKESAESIIKARKEKNALALQDSISTNLASKNIIDIYEQDINELKENPLVSTDEYEKLRKEIYHDIEVYSKDIKDKVVNLLEQLEDLRDVLTNKINIANDTLFTLQRKVYRIKSTIESEDGMITAIQDDCYSRDTTQDALNYILGTQTVIEIRKDY